MKRYAQLQPEGAFGNSAAMQAVTVELKETYTELSLRGGEQQCH
jgi:hypothetical protein